MIFLRQLPGSACSPPGHRECRGSALASALFAAVLLCALPAYADDWNIGIGAGGIAKPEYLGAADVETLAVPAIDIAYRDTVFFNFFEGLSAYLYRQGDFRLKAGVGYQPGRDEDDDESLRGTGDIDSAAVFNVGAEYQFGQYTAFARLLQHQGGTDGRQLQAGIQAFYALREAISSPRLLLNFTFNYSDDDFMQGYFGIDAEQSAGSGQAEYSVRAGVPLVRTGATYIHPLSERWRFTAVLQYRKLIGDAADSPLVADDDQVFGGAFIGYRF